MFSQVQGLIIKTMQDNSALKARVSDRIYPDESNLGSGKDQTLPEVVVWMKQTDRLRDVEAIHIQATITVYSKRGRDDALRIHDLVFTAIYNTRMTTAIDGVNYSGIMEQLTSVEPGYDSTLLKWYAETLWEGNFVKH